MLRQSFMKKYKEKSKFGEERFLKADDAYLLKESRPIQARAIRTLNKKKMNQFIEDVLTDKKLTSVLYASNAKIEIKTYLKTKKNFICKKDEIEKKLKEKNEPSSVVKRRSRKEAYIQMRQEIDEFKQNKENYKRSLTLSNNKKIRAIRDEVAKIKKEYFNDMKTNYIKGFKRSYTTLKSKIDYMKLLDSKQEIENIDMRYLTTMSGRKPTIHFPDAKLNMKDVFSRLYSNEVLPSTTKNVLLKKRPFSNLNKGTSENMKKKQIKFKLKNALTSNNGKEFTIKITQNILNKCYYKYSGGPASIRYKNTDFESKKTKTKNNNYFVDYYSLIDPKTGNTYLHLATLENYPQMVKYFIEKGANINAQNKDGNTPLHIAVEKKYKDIIKLLMDNKAALDIPNKEGNIAFDFFTPEMKKEYGVDTLLIINPAKKK